MWVGWNSLLSPSNLQSKRQNGWYLPQINLSPTSYTVVVETLNRGIQIANECSSQSLCVTYDLAIARMAMKIQQEESPKYDRLFINFGSFHIELAFFHSIGSYIELSGGGGDVLSLAGIIASDSLKGFISGTHYNRCKRIHSKFAAAMEILHFNAFLCLTNTETELLSIHVKQVLEMIDEAGVTNFYGDITSRDTRPTQ